jgi:hypothetical protein
MTKEEFFNFIEKFQLVNKFGKILGLSNKKLANYDKLVEAHRWLNRLTDFLPEDTKFQYRFFVLQNNLTEKDCYCFCGGIKDISSKGNRLNVTCGKKDAEHLNYIKETTRLKQKEAHAKRDNSWSDTQRNKFKKTCLEKYGTTSPLASKEIQEKSKKTLVKKYGVDNPMKNKEIQTRAKETNILKYGVDNPMKSGEIQAKAKETNILKYGGNSPMNSPKIKSKWKNNFIKKYGVDNPLKVQEFKEKMLETCVVIFGVPYASQSPEIKLKTKQTNLKKYGVFNYSQSKEYQKRLPEIRAKIKYAWVEGDAKAKMMETNLKKYGVPYAPQSPAIKSKIEQSFLMKYGVKNISQLPDVKAKIKYAWVEGDAKAKREQTNLKKYGAFSIDGVKAKTARQAHMKNTHLLTKEYLEENFLDENGCIKLQEMMDFFNIKETSCYNYMRELGIKINYKAGGFNPKEPGILYYLYDPETNLYKIGITNRSIEERFGKAFCSNRAIAILEQTYFENGYEALEAEKTLLEEFSYARTINESWPEELGGRTEFFHTDNLNKHNT